MDVSMDDEQYKKALDAYLTSVFLANFDDFLDFYLDEINEEEEEN